MLKPRILLLPRALATWTVVLSAGLAQVQAASLIPSETSVGLDTVGYFHSDPNAAQGFRSSIAPQLVGKGAFESHGAWLEAGAQADALLMFTDKGNGTVKASPYLEVPELYVGTSRELAPVRVSVGRKLERWSRLDEAWELGIWQPRYRWDYLHPETVGLTGAFLTIDLPAFKLVAFGSGFYVPERGVPMETRGGSFASDSRWFIPPPSMVRIFDQDTPVQYRLDLPQMQDLLLQGSGSVMARLGEETGPWVSAAYAYKPINQLRLASDGYLKISARDEIHAQATIFPRVAYHHLGSFEAGYASETVDAWVSALTERPVVAGTPASWTVQQLTPSLALSSMLDVRVASTSGRPTRLDLGYLRQFGGNAGDLGPQAGGAGSSQFEARYPFESAVAVGVKSEAVRRVLATSRLFYDFHHEGAVWSSELRYQPLQSWVMGVGADIMSAPPTDDLKGTDLIGRFRANDRVHAGVTYVF